ncbi:UNVERIFIED_CONTAM: hypothetical protein K2H54_031613 [Gekko kuhli]
MNTVKIKIDNKLVGEKAVCKQSIIMADTPKKLVKTTQRRREANVMKLVVEVIKWIVEQLICINQQLAKMYQQFEPSWHQLTITPEKTEQWDVEVKEMDTKTKSELNKRRKKNTRESGKIYKETILLLQAYSEGIIFNLTDRKKTESAFKTKKPLRCHWVLRMRPERKRLKLSSVAPLDAEEDSAAVHGVIV